MRAIGGSALLLVLVACGRNALDVAAMASSDATAGRSGGRAGAGGASGASSGSGGSAAGSDGISPSDGDGAAGVGGSGALGGGPGTAGASDAGVAGGLGKKIGESCVERIDCASGYCANGVCCTSSCEGSCQSCALPGSNGVCAPLPVNTFCSAAQCNGNMSVPAVRCDGKGACLIPAMPSFDCTPYACDAATGTCRTTCASDADCFNSTCVNGACGFFSDLASCSSNSECASGFCAEGVCCNVACEGSCVSCALPNRIGTCTPVEYGSLDPRGVCRDQGVATCGTNGRCDGQGACSLYPSASTCAPAMCVGTMVTAARLCDGWGTCLPPTQIVSCASGVCSPDGTECGDICPDGVTICAAEAYCSGNGTCTPRKAIGAPCARADECVSFACLAADGGLPVCVP